MRKTLELEHRSRVHCGAATNIDELVARPDAFAEEAHEQRLAKLRSMIGYEVLHRFGTFQERHEYSYEIVESVSVHVMSHAELLEFRRACREELIDDLTRVLKEKRKK